MKKIIGLDLGSRTCGVAISDALGMFSRNLTTIRFKDDDYEYASLEVIKLINEYNIEEVVLGMPKHMNGDIGIRGKISEDFKVLLLQKANINVILWDERLTTVAANNAMISQNVRREDRKKLKDELAAALILQNYLDFKK